MRYIRSERSFRQYQPKKSHWSLKGLFFRSPRKITSPAIPNHAYQAPRPKKISPSLAVRQFAPKALPIIMLLWLAFLIYLPYFKVTRVSVTGLSILDPNQLKHEVETQFFTGTLWPRNNYFLFTESKILAFLQSHYAFDTVEIKKVFPHELIIQVTEKVPTLVYDNGAGYYLVDKNGLAFQRLKGLKENEFSLIDTASASSAVDSSSTQNVAALSADSLAVKAHVPDYASLILQYGRYPLVYVSAASVSTSLDAALSRVVLKPEVAAGLSSFFSAIQASKLATPHYIVMDNPLAGATLYTNQSWHILFQPLFDASDQLAKLKTIIKANHPSSYVDLRFGTRIYWK